MHKDVLISIKGTVIPQDNDPDVIELVTAGRYYKKNGDYFIRYKESETTGFDGATTTLKVNGGKSVILTRNGREHTQMILENGKRHLCQYNTDYGPILVGVSGCHIDSQLSETGGELSFNYTLDVNSNLVSKNEVYISVKEANTSDVRSDEYCN